jgi:hypothetical protein
VALNHYGGRLVASTRMQERDAKKANRLSEAMSNERRR